MEIKIPELSLVMLIGTSSSGKSTFAKKHFKATEVISSDYCRAMVSDDENSKEATADAFDLAHYMIKKRLKRGHLTVMDATNVQREARNPLVTIAKEYHFLPVAIVLNIPVKICQERHQARTDRDFGRHVIRNQHNQLQRHINRLQKEGIRKVFVINSVEELEQVTITRQKMWNNKKHESAPFDIIGDVHGCYDELIELLTKLDYSVQFDKEAQDYTVSHPKNRRVIFVGDLIDRGPASDKVLHLAMSMVKAGMAFCVCGNHDAKLLRRLNGRNVKLTHGLDKTVEQLSNRSAEFMEELRHFLDGLISHLIFDDGKLLIAHAGLREDMHGRASGAIRSFCLYGDVTGEKDEYGMPVRLNWAKDYKGKTFVVYGHTPVGEVAWLNNTANIDTGCVFGGKLTALRYPEKTLVEVEAKEEYAKASRPFLAKDLLALNPQQAHDDLLYYEDVSGKRVINTRLKKNITIRTEHAIAALETMSRFAVNPKWLIYLPPTMSPSETSQLDDYLEHPVEVFTYFKKQGVRKVICEEKHMGSRAVVIVGKDEAAIRQEFGIQNEGIGTIYTRTGRAFFSDKNLEIDFLNRLNAALSKAKFWETHQTNWVALDCELMPWSSKAQSLIQQQYAAVGTAANGVLPSVAAALKAAQDRGIDLGEMANQFEQRIDLANQFRDAYRPYCWTVDKLDDFKLAPFHILATQGKVHTDKNHEWHMQQIHQFCKADPDFLLATNYKIVDLDINNDTIQNAVDWWVELTKEGGEGVVVKPYDFIPTTIDQFTQPAIKCRGKEYLRIIYGMDYTLPENLKTLKKRGLSKKRSMAFREFALGIEALERFVNKAALRQVHECVFGVLAMESEPVDPRL